MVTFEVPMSPQLMQKLMQTKLLRERTGNSGEHVIGVPPDQTHSADHQYQDDGEHNGIFGDILSFFVRANTMKKLKHKSSGGGSGVANNADLDGNCQSPDELVLRVPELAAQVK